jgi:hypothetical protein
MVIYREKLVYELTINITARTAPINPPIYENTADIFCTWRLYVMEAGDLRINILAKGVSGLIWYGYITGS